MNVWVHSINVTSAIELRASDPMEEKAEINFTRLKTQYSPLLWGIEMTRRQGI
jgi:hypothetical protein